MVNVQMSLSNENFIYLKQFTVHISTVNSELSMKPANPVTPIFSSYHVEITQTTGFALF